MKLKTNIIVIVVILFAAINILTISTSDDNNISLNGLRLKLAYSETTGNGCYAQVRDEYWLGDCKMIVGDCWYGSSWECLKGFSMFCDDGETLCEWENKSCSN